MKFYKSNLSTSCNKITSSKIYLKISQCLDFLGFILAFTIVNSLSRLYSFIVRLLLFFYVFPSSLLSAFSDAFPFPI